MKLPSGYVPGSGVHKASGFGGFGERLLRKQGWEKGEGLGKNKTGRAEAIQVKKKEDTSGVCLQTLFLLFPSGSCGFYHRYPVQVGASRGQIVSDKWWEGAFDTALHVVNHEVRSDLVWNNSGVTSVSLTLRCLQDSSSDSDSDVSTADEVTVSVRNSDGTITSAAQHELQIAAELAAQPAWFGGGRFGGREGKLARIRQQEALAAAKLGLALPKPELASATGLPRASKKRKAPHNTSAETGSSPATEPVGVPNVKYKSSRKVKDKQAVMDQQVALSSQPDASVPDLSPDVRPAGKKPIIVEPAFTATVPAVPFVQTPASGWWGAKKFKSAGVLEGMEQPQSKLHSERQQFDEDDQTNLYMAAQTLKTSGKKGLGTKSHIGGIPCALIQSENIWQKRAGNKVSYRWDTLCFDSVWSTKSRTSRTCNKKLYIGCFAHKHSISSFYCTVQQRVLRSGYSVLCCS